MDSIFTVAPQIDEFRRPAGLKVCDACSIFDPEGVMADLTVAWFEEMEPIYGGIARRARATLGVSAFGMQVITLPADWDGYPDHRHDASVEDANQEEGYISL